VQGLYRHVRNPIYLGVTLVLLGEAVLVGGAGLVLYWAAWFTAVNVFVIAYEEPYPRKRFGAAYVQYAAHVGRWIPGAAYEARPVASGGHRRRE
jgi:protein-S-isoprenylcysteine O-methyltransferase Ste14